jgi:hypothetical protein
VSQLIKAKFITVLFPKFNNLVLKILDQTIL